MFEVLPPQGHSSRFPLSAPPAARSINVVGGEPSLRVGSLVKALQPRRGVMLDRAEQQCLDLELDFICGRGLVGKVVRVAPHSIVVDFVLSGADYKAIYPGPTIIARPKDGSAANTAVTTISIDRSSKDRSGGAVEPHQAEQQPSQDKSGGGPVDGEAESSLDQSYASSSVRGGGGGAATPIVSHPSHHQYPGEGDNSSSDHSNNNNSFSGHTNMSCSLNQAGGAGGTGGTTTSSTSPRVMVAKSTASAPSYLSGTAQVENADKEELIDIRKTLPINYVSLLVELLDSERQSNMKQRFADQEFHIVMRLAQEWIDEILQVEALDLTDVAYHYQRMAGEEEHGTRGSVRVDEEGGSSASSSTTPPKPVPQWLLKMPSSLTATLIDTVGINLAAHLRSLRRAAARHLLSWLYICNGMCKLQLGLGVTESAAVLSCGRRATMLDPSNARAYSILISTFHCTSQLDLSAQMIHQCEKHCPAPNRADCEWLRSLLLLDSVYRLYNPKLRPFTNNTHIRIPLEVTIPGIQEKPCHLGLTTLQDFQPSEVILSEVPCVWIPLASAVVTMTSSMNKSPQGKAMRRTRSNMMNPLSAHEANDVSSCAAGGGGLFAVFNSGGCEPTTLLRAPQPPPLPSSVSEGTSPRHFSVEGPVPVPQCAMCGFVLAKKSFVVNLLNEKDMADVAQRYVDRYPERSTVPCRSGIECSRVFCSNLCEEQAWTTFHRVDCTKAGLLTKQHQQTLRLAAGNVDTATDAALQLFNKVTLMAFCHTETKMLQAGIDYAHPDVSSFANAEVAAFLGSLPIVTKLHPGGYGSSVPAVSTTLHVMSVMGPNHNAICQVYEPFAHSVYQHCLLSHRIVSRCPVTSVMKARPRKATWPAIAQHFEAKMLCLFPVMGCALAPEQRGIVRKKSQHAGMYDEQQGVSDSLFSIASSSNSSLEDVSDSGDGESEADGGGGPNVTVESTPGDCGKGYFTMRCPDHQGLSAKSDIIPPLSC